MNYFLRGIFLVAFSVITLNGNSQTKKGKYILFKLYKNTFFDLGNTQGTTTVEFLPFSPAVSWGEDRKYHEVEINSVDFFSRGGGAGQSYSAGAQYSYNYRFSKDDEYYFQLFIGGGFGGGFKTNLSTQILSPTISYNTLGKDITASAFLIPRATYKLRSNIFLEMSLNYEFFTYKHTRSKVDNPALPVNQRNTTFNEAKFFPSALTLKVGGIIEF